MEFKTAISKMTDDDLIIRGKRHSEMVANWPFAKTVFFLLSGKEPDKKEAALFDAMLTLCIDHGMGTASSLATRFVQSTGNPLNASVAAGVLALGDLHGGAIENAMVMLTELQEKKTDLDMFVTDALEKKRILSGFGHKVYKEQDPRTRQLVELCQALEYDPEYLALAIQMADVIEAQKGRRLVLNVDGAIAALLLEMGFAPEMGKGFFIIARTPSLVAQAVEERTRERPVRRLDESEIEYLGEK